MVWIVNLELTKVHEQNFQSAWGFVRTSSQNSQNLWKSKVSFKVLGFISLINKSNCFDYKYGAIAVKK